MVDTSLLLIFAVNQLLKTETDLFQINKYDKNKRITYCRSDRWSPCNIYEKILFSIIKLYIILQESQYCDSYLLTNFTLYIIIIM